MGGIGWDHNNCMSIVLPLEFQVMEGKFKGSGLEGLAPPPEVYELCWSHEQIFQEVDGKRYRRIFFNIEYEPEEQRNIAELRRDLQAEGLNDHFTDAVILKNFIAAKFSHGKCL